MNNITLHTDAVLSAITIFEKTYQDYSLKLNNEIADILRDANLKVKTKGLLGLKISLYSGHDYFQYKAQRFKNVQELVWLRRKIISAHEEYSEAYKENQGVEIKLKSALFNGAKSTTTDDDAKIQKLLDEISELLKVDFSYSI